jgi:DNA-binding MarR family transcriptional regulator
MPRGTAAAPAAIDDVPCACAAARRVARAFTQVYDGCLRAHEIEAPQFSLMSMLDAQGACSHAMMARRFGLDKTTLSRNLKRLERKGWIRVSAGADARERRVALTAAGRARLAAARPAWQRAQAQLRSSMRDRDWDAMWRVFRTITHAAWIAQRAADQKVRAQ